MSGTHPNVEKIETLTSDQVARVVAVLNLVNKTQSFLSGMRTLSRRIDHADPTAAALSKAARKHEDGVRLQSAVRWAYQANLHSDSLTNKQFEALTAPWSAH